MVVNNVQMGVMLLGIDDDGLYLLPTVVQRTLDVGCLTLDVGRWTAGRCMDAKVDLQCVNLLDVVMA